MLAAKFCAECFRGDDVSRIGLAPVNIPDGVEISIDGQALTAKGKLGELSHVFTDEVTLSRDDSTIVVKPRDESGRARAMWGMSRTLVNNIVTGVSQGFTRKLEISGVGYRAAIQGDILNLQLGYSHEVKIAIPSDVTVKCEKPTEIMLSGANRQRVGQFAADIRALRKPEPYKGKGIRYADEYVRRKEGKKK